MDTNNLHCDTMYSTLQVDTSVLHCDTKYGSPVGDYQVSKDHAGQCLHFLLREKLYSAFSLQYFKYYDRWYGKLGIFIIALFTKYYWGNHITVEVAETYNMHGRNEKWEQILVRKTTRKRPLGQPSQSRSIMLWTYNKKIRWDNVDWMHLPLDKDQWWPLVNRLLSGLMSVRTWASSPAWVCTLRYQSGE